MAPKTDEDWHTHNEVNALFFYVSVLHRLLTWRVCTWRTSRTTRTSHAPSPETSLTSLVTSLTAVVSSLEIEVPMIDVSKCQVDPMIDDDDHPFLQKQNLAFTVYLLGSVLSLPD